VEAQSEQSVQLAAVKANGVLDARDEWPAAERHDKLSRLKR